ncbi:hypothetical protein OAL22_01115, partial [bacterium]|nr:hypothetical protein [bacterium]
MFLSKEGRRKPFSRFPLEKSVTMSIVEEDASHTMIQLRTSFTALALTLFLASFSRAEFLINEFLAENTGTSFNDEDGFPADWIEIHNPGPAASINGYHLTDDPTNLTKWTFPNVTIPANVFGGNEISKRIADGVEDGVEDGATESVAVGDV